MVISNNPPPSQTIKNKLNFSTKVINSTSVQSFLHLFNNPIDVSDNLVDDGIITYNNKVVRLFTLYTRWADKNIEEETLVRDALQTCQQSRYKEFGLIVFRFTFYETQIEIIQKLLFEQRNFLLNAKIGFRKNFIFQLVLFFTTTSGIVLPLMSLKLLQIEQNKLINWLSKERNIVFNSENIHHNIFNKVSKGEFTHVFISSEIAISKKFKKCILEHFSFTNCLSILVIDEIYLLKKWNKNFDLIYTKIEKF